MADVALKRGGLRVTGSSRVVLHLGLRIDAASNRRTNRPLDGARARKGRP